MEFGTELMIMNEAFVEPFHWPSFYWYNTVVNKISCKEPQTKCCLGIIRFITLGYWALRE